MKLSFSIGLVIVIVAFLIGFLSSDFRITLKITGFTVAGCFVISGILNGSVVNGDIYRSNYLSETKEDRDNKMTITKHLLFLSIPSIIVSAIILIFNYYNQG